MYFIDIDLTSVGIAHTYNMYALITFNMWPSKQKPAMFAYKLNSFYCSSLYISTLNITMHIYCLHWLMSINLLLQSAFSDHVNSRLVKWYQWRAPICQWGPDIAPTVSKCLSRPCSGLLGTCGCMSNSYIATLNSTIVSSCLFI